MKAFGVYIALAAISIVLPVSEALCACSTGNVNVRSGSSLSSAILGVLNSGHCVDFKAHLQTSNGITWANVDYKHMDAYISTNYLHFNHCNVVQTQFNQECGCATTSVHVRATPSLHGSISGTLAPGHCVSFKGPASTVDNINWANVDYNGHNGYVSMDYLHFGACSHATSPSHSTHAPSTNGCPRIISRAEWHASPPAGHFGHFTHQPRYVFVHHGASQPCFTQDACAAQVRAYQNYHINTHHWSDIGYSFVIGEDGNVYEANGWDIVGAHTYGHNSVGIGICIIGDFRERVPNDLAINALKNLIACGVSMNKLPSNYIVQGHCDVKATACPGHKLLELIRTWPHYHKPATSTC